MPSQSASFQVVEDIHNEKDVMKSHKWSFLIAATILLISGSYDSIGAKLMNLQKEVPCNGCKPRYFEAPFFQTLAMYIGGDEHFDLYSITLSFFQNLFVCWPLALTNGSATRSINPRYLGSQHPKNHS